MGYGPIVHDATLVHHSTASVHGGKARPKNAKLVV